MIHVLFSIGTFPKSLFFVRSKPATHEVVEIIVMKVKSRDTGEVKEQYQARKTYFMLENAVCSIRLLLLEFSGKLKSDKYLFWCLPAFPEQFYSHIWAQHRKTFLLNYFSRRLAFSDWETIELCKGSLMMLHLQIVMSPLLGRKGDALGTCFYVTFVAFWIQPQLSGHNNLLCNKVMQHYLISKFLLKITWPIATYIGRN